MAKIKKSMTESLEDYIEMVYLLSERNGQAQVRDIAKNLHITMPSVVKAIKELQAMELVAHEPYGGVQLTEKGVREAKFVLGRHTLIKKFLRQLGVGEVNAERDACLMEHDLSMETIERIRKAVDKAERAAKTANHKEKGK